MLNIIILQSYDWFSKSLLKSLSKKKKNTITMFLFNKFYIDFHKYNLYLLDILDRCVIQRLDD